MLKLLNYNEHPTRKAFTVFHFFVKERADDFQVMLDENQIWYESDVDNSSDRTIYFFGIKNADFDKTLKLNHLVIAKHRQPTIANRYLRIAIYLIALGVLALAVVSYFKNGTRA